EGANNLCASPDPLQYLPSGTALGQTEPSGFVAGATDLASIADAGEAWRGLSDHCGGAGRWLQSPAFPRPRQQRCMLDELSPGKRVLTISCKLLDELLCIWRQKPFRIPRNS